MDGEAHRDETQRPAYRAGLAQHQFDAARDMEPLTLHHVLGDPPDLDWFAGMLAPLPHRTTCRCLHCDPVPYAAWEAKRRLAGQVFR